MIRGPCCDCFTWVVHGPAVVVRDLARLQHQIPYRNGGETSVGNLAQQLDLVHTPASKDGKTFGCVPKTCRTGSIAGRRTSACCWAKLHHLRTPRLASDRGTTAGGGRPEHGLHRRPVSLRDLAQILT